MILCAGCSASGEVSRQLFLFVVIRKLFGYWLISMSRAVYRAAFGCLEDPPAGTLLWLSWLCSSLHTLLTCVCTATRDQG